MEGDVEAILPRPTLPVSSPDPNNPSNSVHRYASRDLRTREAQAEIEKWDAWHACAGMSRTEAKRQYISTLINTMKEYASGTAESRELVGELEFVWNQIKSQSGSDPDNHSGGSPSDHSPESATRKLERAGIAGGLERSQSQINSMSFRSDRPSIGSTDLGGMLSRQASGSQKPQKQSRLKRTESGLRVLSPVSQEDEDSVMEVVDENNDDDNDNDDDEQLDTAPTSPLANRTRAQGRGTNQRQPSNDALTSWQQTLETQLHALKTEIAALREQLSANHLLSSSSFSHTYYTMNTRQRIIHRVKLYIRTFGSQFLKQFTVQLGMLALVLLWGRLNGDLRIEKWVREKLARFQMRIRGFMSTVFFSFFDLFGRDGKLRFVGRVLRTS